MRLPRVHLAFALLFAGVGTATASSTSVQAEIHVPPIQNLETTPGVLEIAPVTVTDLERGILEIAEAVTLTISSNVPWELFVRRTDPSGPVLQGSLEHGPFHDIGTTWVSFATGPAGADRVIRQLRLRLAVRWTTADPGDHGLRLAYRLVPRGH